MSAPAENIHSNVESISSPVKDRYAQYRALTAISEVKEKMMTPKTTKKSVPRVIVQPEPTNSPSPPQKKKIRYSQIKNMDDIVANLSPLKNQSFVNNYI